MIQWEYAQVDRGYRADSDVLAERGRAGWELAAVTEACLFFKRPLRPAVETKPARYAGPPPVIEYKGR